eukprot:13544689-Alexandrium_andersonii.AAC.1
MGALSPKILLGSKKVEALENPCLHAKAMESRCLCFFSMHLLAERLPQLTVRLMAQHKAEAAAQGATLLQAGRALKRWFGIINGHGRVVPAGGCRDLLHWHKAFCALFRQAGGILRPKFHAMYELTRGVNTFGNPR